MNSAVRISSAICQFGINPSVNLCKISVPYTKKTLLANVNNSRNCEYKCYSHTNVDNENKTSPSWYIKDGGHFNKGLGIASVATAISVSAIVYYKYKKGVKAESGKKQRRRITEGRR